MTYCSKCGSPVEGKFCAKCGSPVGVAPGAGPGSVPPSPAAPPVANRGLGMDENLAAALSYIPIVGLIFLLVEPYNKNRTIKFHAMQSVFYCIAWIAVGIVLGIFGGVLMPLGMWSFWLLISRLVQLALFVGWGDYGREGVSGHQVRDADHRTDRGEAGGLILLAGENASAT
jgi:uncharacterized membrane protein